MIDKTTWATVQEVENIILQVVDEAEELTRSDLKGRASVEAMNIIRLIKSQIC